MSNVQDLLTAEQKSVLGAGQLDWFATLSRDPVACPPEKDGQQQEVDATRSGLGAPAAPAPTEPLLSPDAPVGGALQHGRAQKQNSASLLSQETPGDAAVTPAQAAGRNSDVVLRMSRFGYLKRASSVSVKRSLGLEHEESGFSWTSSLATPPTYSSEEDEGDKPTTASPVHKTPPKLGPSRNLFGGASEFESSKEFDTTEDKIEAMALVSEVELENEADSMNQTLKPSQHGEDSDVVTRDHLSGISSSLRSEQNDPMDIFDTPPSRAGLGKKKAPKSAKRVDPPDDIFSPPNSQPSASDGVVPTMEGSTDSEITFKTPVVRKSVPGGVAGVKVPQCDGASSGPPTPGIPSSGEFDIQTEIEKLQASPAVTQKGLATSTPIASRCSSNMEVDVTPIHKPTSQTDPNPKRVHPDLNDPQPNTSDQENVVPLKRKRKRFSYPTSSQIERSCPKKVFNKSPLTNSKPVPNTEQEKSRAGEVSENGAVPKLSKEAAGRSSALGSLRWKFTSGFTSLTTYAKEVGVHELPKSPAKITEDGLPDEEASGLRRTADFRFTVNDVVRIPETSARAEHRETKAGNVGHVPAGGEQEKQKVFERREIATSKLSIGSARWQGESGDGPQHSGFHSAGGRPISLSEAARERASRIFAELDAQEAVGSVNGGRENEQQGAPQCVGFHSAGGKTIAVSEAARQRASRIFAELNAEQDNADDRLINRNPVNRTPAHISRTEMARNFETCTTFSGREDTRVTTSVSEGTGYRPLKPPGGSSNDQGNAVEAAVEEATETEPQETESAAKNALDESEPDEFDDSFDVRYSQIAMITQNLKTAEAADAADFSESDDILPWTQMEQMCKDASNETQSESEGSFRTADAGHDASTADGLEEYVSAADETLQEAIASELVSDLVDEACDRSAVERAQQEQSTDVDQQQEEMRADDAHDSALPRQEITDSAWDTEFTDSMVRLADEAVKAVSLEPRDLEEITSPTPKYEATDHSYSRTFDASGGNDGSFMTASGYVETVQDDSVQRAKDLLSDIHTDDHTGGEPIPFTPFTQSVERTDVQVGDLIGSSFHGDTGGDGCHGDRASHYSPPELETESIANAKHEHEHEPREAAEAAVCGDEGLGPYTSAQPDENGDEISPSEVQALMACGSFWEEPTETDEDLRTGSVDTTPRVSEWEENVVPVDLNDRGVASEGHGNETHEHNDAESLDTFQNASGNVSVEQNLQDEGIVGRGAGETASSDKCPAKPPEEVEMNSISAADSNRDSDTKVGPPSDDGASLVNSAHSPVFGFRAAAGQSPAAESEDTTVSQRGLFPTEGQSELPCFEQESNKAAGTKETPVIKGFYTASGKKQNVLEESLRKAKARIAADNRASNTAGDVSSAHSEFIGFRTAGGRKERVSEESLNLARAKFAEASRLCGLSRGPDGPRVSSTESEERRSVPSPKQEAPKVEARTLRSGSSFGFQTAGGGSVSVKPESLQRAKRLSADAGGSDEAQSADRERTCEENELENPKPQVAQFGGFSTANGNAVQVSEESVRRARQMFSTLHEPDNQKNVVPQAAGFATASGNKVTVSEASLQRAKKIFSTTEEESAKADDPKFPSGFATARGDKVRVSEESLKLARKVLSTQEEGSAVNPSPSAPFSADKMSCTGFQTAKGKTVEVSRSALEKARERSRDFELRQEAAVPVLAKHDEEDGKAFTQGHSQPRTRGSQDSGFNPAELLEVERSVQAFLNDDDADLDEDWKDGRPSGVKAGAEGGDNSTSKTESLDSASPLAQASSDRRRDDGLKSGFSRKTKAGWFQDPRSNPTTPAFRTPVKVPAATSFVTPVKSDSGFTVPRRVSEPTASAGESPATQEGSGEHELLPRPQNESQKRDSGSDEVVKERTRAKVAQAHRIRAKKERSDTRPAAGQLQEARTAGPRPKLCHAVRGSRPQSYSLPQLLACGVRESTAAVRAANAEDFRFCAAELRGDAGTAVRLRVGDGAELVLAEDGTAGKHEFSLALLDSEGVEPRLVSHDWVHNHYRWIVWKLAATEVAFPQQFGGRYLTPHQVMLQLKFRYDREIDNSERSALKKIYEQDDTPGKGMVLCVASIDRPPDTNQSCSLLLTDGWYSIRSAIDAPLVALVEQGRIRVGDKLCLFGAELVGNPEPSPPLQAAPDVTLRIGANGTRRARWDARLGFLRRPQPPLLPLSSLRPAGGPAACVDVVVTRVYPLQFMEKRADGATVWRCERAETRAAQQFETQRNKHLEKLFAKVEAEFEKESHQSASDTSSAKRKWTERDIRSLHSGGELHDALTSARDPASFEMCLSGAQRERLAEHKRRLHEERQQELQAEFRRQMAHTEATPARNVVPLVKIRLAGCSVKDTDTKTSVLLTVWRPQMCVTEMLKEGKRFKIFNVAVGENRSRQDKSRISLTANRSTRYQETEVDDNFLDLVYEPREVVGASELKPGFETFANEVDFVGMVIRTSRLNTFDRQRGGEGCVQTAYLADCSGDLCAVKFWGGLAAYGVEDMLSPSCVVACANLQWRPEERGGGGALPTLTASDFTVFSVKPRDAHLSSAVTKFRSIVQDVPYFMKRACDKLDSAFGGVVRANSSYVMSPRPLTPRTPLNNTSRAQSPFNITSRAQTPLNIVSRAAAPHRRCPTPTGGTPMRRPAGPTGLTRPAAMDKDGLPYVQQNAPADTDKLIGPGSAVGLSDAKENTGGLSDTEGNTNAEESSVSSTSLIGYGAGTTSDSDASFTSSESRSLDMSIQDPKAASRKALQKLKARQLLQYGIAPAQSPLTSPVPEQVRKAFKPPAAAARTAATPVASKPLPRKRRKLSSEIKMSPAKDEAAAKTSGSGAQETKRMTNIGAEPQEEDQASNEEEKSPPSKVVDSDCVKCGDSEGACASDSSTQTNTKREETEEDRAEPKKRAKRGKRKRSCVSDSGPEAEPEPEPPKRRYSLRRK